MRSVSERPIPDSQVATGTRDIRRAWLGTPVDRYGHAALGSRIIVVEAQAEHGAALVVFNVAGPATAPRLQERARGPYVGTMRWLNPVGAADFDGDGKLELVSVTTPHIGGILTLYRLDPPRLVSLAREANVSNHRLGAVEQRLAGIVSAPGAAPWVLVPDQSRRQLRMLGWSPRGGWMPLAENVTLAAAAERIEVHPLGACVTLDDGSGIWVPYPRMANVPLGSKR